MDIMKQACFHKSTNKHENSDMQVICLFGGQASGGRQAAISADEVAGWLDTVNYEVTCLLSDRVPRVYRNQAPGVTV